MIFLQQPPEVKVQPPVTQRKATLSLFDDDEEDDLFGVTTPLAKSTTGQKSTVMVKIKCSHNRYDHVKIL